MAVNGNSPSPIAAHPQTADDLAHSPVRPSAPVHSQSFQSSRPAIVGPDVPEAPFPIAMKGAVQEGFGRGGKDLGCPTANLPDDALHPMATVASPGIYFGYAQVVPHEDETPALCDDDCKVYPMAMSLGWNPYYKNERLSAEVHIIHNYSLDFYGREMRVLVLGYIRPELDYTTREALIADIEIDIRVALNSLDRPAYSKYATNEFFSVRPGADSGSTKL